MASTESRSLLTPREISKPGKLADGIWLIGTVVRVREIKKDAQSEERSAKPSKGGKKGKNSWKGGKQSPQASVPLEININGGKTPADVMMIHAWEEGAVSRLKPFIHKGKKIMISKLTFKEHTEKSSTWTTSRPDMYGVIDGSSEIQPYEGEAPWLHYHPVTPLPSLQHLPTNTFVCVAGMVLSPGPQQKHENVEGAGLVAIANFLCQNQK